MKKIISLILTSFMLLQFLKAQTALDFEIVLEKVEIPTITCPSEFTFEAWINSREQGSFRTILEFENDRPYFGLRSSNLILFNAVTSTTAIPLNEWIHVATTYSSINMEAKLYINGVLNNTATGVTLNITGVGAGIGQNLGDLVFGGSIDNVSIWNVVRSEAEIFADMNTCLDGSETELYAHYNFNEGTGTIANDLTSNGFNGTLINLDPATDWVPYNNCNTNTLSTEEFNINTQIILFPNPSTNALQVSGLKKAEHYSIYNSLGVIITSGTISENEKIHIQNLNSGIYFFKIKDNNTLKFIKK